MFFQQFCDDLVLALELLPQRRDGAEVLALVRSVLALEGGGAVLEELLLPEVKQGRLELVLVAEIGDGHLVDQMASEDGDLLRGRVVPGGLSDRRNSSRVVV